MQNVAMEVKGDTLYIAVKLDAKRTPSSSGKTNVVASTEGNAKIPGASELLRIGLNVFEFKAKGA